VKVRNSSRKIKSLEYSIEHLKLELEELSEEMQDYVADFTKSLYETADFNEEHNKLADTSENVNEFVQLSDMPVLPDDLRKLWKKIALITHPDKTGNNPRLTRLYRRASDAVKTSSAQELVQIAVELGIESPTINREITLAALIELQANLSTKLLSLQNSTLIKWGRSQNEEEKKFIMDFYISSKGYKNRGCNS